jgi:hypothetical protein
MLFRFTVKLQKVQRAVSEKAHNLPRCGVPVEDLSAAIELRNLDNPSGTADNHHNPSLTCEPDHAGYPCWLNLRYES